MSSLTVQMSVSQLKNVTVTNNKGDYYNGGNFKLYITDFGQ